jgi:hypothetical protein
MLINELEETEKEKFRLSLSKEPLNDDKRQLTPLSGNLTPFFNIFLARGTLSKDAVAETPRQNQRALRKK